MSVFATAGDLTAPLNALAAHQQLCSQKRHSVHTVSLSTFPFFSAHEICNLSKECEGIVARNNLQRVFVGAVPIASVECSEYGGGGIPRGGGLTLSALFVLNLL